MIDIENRFANHFRAVTGQHPEQAVGTRQDEMRRDFMAGVDAAHAMIFAVVPAPARPSLFERIFGKGP